MPLTSRTFDQLINFTRTSAATFVGSNGLIQTTPQSVNLLTFTQEFDNGAWTKAAVTVTANSTTAPDGTSTADTLVETVATSAHTTLAGATVPTAATAFSVYLKKGTGATAPNWVQLYTGGVSTQYANFNLGTGVVGNVAAGSTAAITAIGNGWYRCVLYFTPATPGAVSAVVAFTNNTDTTTRGLSYAGATTSDVFVWGAQLQTGSTATTYTRNFGGLFPPRFDYNPVTLAPLGLLIEEQRTNLFTYSADFTNAAWGKANITATGDAATAPDGTATADKLEVTATGVGTVGSRSITSVAGTTAAYSIYVKQGTGATVANGFALRNSTTSTNLISGTLNYTTGVWTYTTGSTGVTVQNAGNGWWRLTLAASSGITSGDTLTVYYGYVGGTSVTAGDHFFIWGAQLEVGPFASSYIPTVVSQVTRTSDQPTIAAPNFAPWYNSSEGTLVTEYDVNGINTVSEVVATISDATANNLFLPFVNSGGSTFINVISGGVTSANLNAGLVATNTTIKLATVYRVNDFAASQNGAVPTVDTAGAVPVGANRLDIGWAANYGGLFLNGHLRRLFFYPTRLTNAQLQALST